MMLAMRGALLVIETIEGSAFHLFDEDAGTCVTCSWDRLCPCNTNVLAGAQQKRSQNKVPQ